MKKWKIASLLIMVGLTVYIINLTVFLPRWFAFVEAMKSWNYLSNSSMPSPITYGWDSTSLIVSTVLGNVAGILILIGVVYLVLVLVIRIGRQLGYAK